MALYLYLFVMLIREIPTLGQMSNFTVETMDYTSNANLSKDYRKVISLNKIDNSLANHDGQLVSDKDVEDS